MHIWTFKSYLNEDGTDDFDMWLNTRPKTARAKMLERVDAFRHQPQSNWNGKRSKQLHGFNQLLEIRFKADKVQHRPIGFFGPQKGEFTLLIGALEKGGKFVPKNAPEKAEQRKAIVTADPRRARNYDI